MNTVFLWCLMLDVYDFTLMFDARCLCYIFFLDVWCLVLMFLLIALMFDVWCLYQQQYFCIIPFIHKKSWSCLALLYPPKPHLINLSNQISSSQTTSSTSQTTSATSQTTSPTSQTKSFSSQTKSFPSQTKSWCGLGGFLDVGNAPAPTGKEIFKKESYQWYQWVTSYLYASNVKITQDSL